MRQEGWAWASPRALAGGQASRTRIATEPAAVQALPVKLVYRSNYRLTPAMQRFVDRVVAEGRSRARQLGELGD